MRNQPLDLTAPTIAGSLLSGWGIDAADIVYAPVGFGSYHWQATAADGRRWFVTADRLEPHGHSTAQDAGGVLAELDACYQTAAALARDGLEFVVAPLPDANGGLVREVTTGWALAVFPFVDAAPVGSGGWTGLDARADVAAMIGRLHAATPPACLQRWSFALPGRDELSAAMEELDAPWTVGLYGERLRRLLAVNRERISELLASYDRLVEAVEPDNEPWVVSHGEPHSSNILRDAVGRLYLIDWDSVRLAPRERDLETLLGEDADAAALAAYQRHASGAYQPQPVAMALFRAWWPAADFCEYVRRFRRPHTDGLDEQKSWLGIERFLAEARNVEVQ